MMDETSIIVKKIIIDAKKEAQSIIDEAHLQAKLLNENRQNAAIDEAKEEVSAILNRGRREVDILWKRIISEAEREAKWVILTEKEQLINKVLDMLKEKLQSLHNSKYYVKLLENMIVEAGTTIEGGHLLVQLNKRDEKITLDFNALSKVIADKIGEPTTLEAHYDDTEFIGGLIAQRFDNRAVIDYTFDNILQLRERQIKLAIAKVLFEGI